MSASLLAPTRWSYDVFPSFSGQDVRRNFLGHLLGEFQRKGINTFVDDQIRRGESIGPELVQAIRASRIGIVILTKNYASSSWCLDELLEIMECKETAGQTVMTIFYDMKPSDVRNQTGEFGEAFQITCEGKTEEQKQSWKEALTDVANVAGEDSHNWDSEAAMVLKVATDISKLLNITPSRDFDNLVGMEAHITKMNSLLCMESNEVRVVGIWGPAGIDAEEIYNVLADKTGTGSVLGISFNMSEINPKNSDLILGLDCLPLPRKLKLLHWEACPMKHMSFKFDPVWLIEINMKWSNLKKLWDGVPKLRSLKTMKLNGSANLEELPDFSEAEFLEHLDMRDCRSLRKLPPSIWELRMLNFLDLHSCINLEPFPISANKTLLSLSYLDISDCSEFIDFPEISDYIEYLDVSSTEISAVPSSVEDLGDLRIKEVPPWISDLYGLKKLLQCKNSLPTNTPETTDDFPLRLYMSENDFISIPDSVVQKVQYLYLSYCRELVSLPELPESLSELYADDCVSLERLSQSSRSPHDPKLILNFINCSKLGQEARELIIQQWACGYAVLPGSEVPYYFTHQARGSSLTIRLNQGELDESLRFKACVVLPPRDELDDVSFCHFQISCYVRGKHSASVYKWPEIYVDESKDLLLEDHLFILNSYFPLEEDNIPEGEILFDFRCVGMKYNHQTLSTNIRECGVQLLEPCSCEYDSIAHPELSTIPHGEKAEDNNNNIVETRRSNKRELSSVAEGVEKASKNPKTSY
ncbi:hypothetical protein AALP_AAs63622U000200 [Arabis alpina]|uniref:TIR domain-containing protein n=1 Tax=Arabis alpina TaxID=50452 RepID=A0A087G0D4_ARAAL|nr:hypothetical protein AALP_AAs63622U000200 [Arabis alpina]